MESDMEGVRVTAKRGHLQATMAKIIQAILDAVMKEETGEEVGSKEPDENGIESE